MDKRLFKIPLRNQPLKKLLAQLKTVEKVGEEISPDVFGESIDEDPFGSPGTPAPNASLPNDEENEIVGTFLPRNPHITKESITLPCDPVERDRRLQFMNTITAALTNAPGMVFFCLDPVLIDTGVHISPPRRVVRSSKPSQPISREEYDYFMKNRDNVMNAPLPFHMITAFETQHTMSVC